MVASKPYHLRFVSNLETFAFAQSVFNLLHTDFDFKHIVAKCQREPKYGVVLRRTPRPKRQRPVVVSESTKSVNKRHPGAAHRSDMAAVPHIPAHVGQIH